MGVPAGRMISPLGNVTQAYAKARLAFAASVKSANSPRPYFRNAAAAIMAALSVERWGVGKRTGIPTFGVCAASRKPELHATPPDTMRERALISPADFAARRNSSSMTVA